MAKNRKSKNRFTNSLTRSGKSYAPTPPALDFSAEQPPNLLGVVSSHGCAPPCGAVLDAPARLPTTGHYSNFFGDLGHDVTDVALFAAFGAGQIEMLGICMQRSWIILIASSLLMGPLYLFSTPILKLLGQEDDIANAAGKLTVRIIPQMFALSINFPTQKFLQSQSKVFVLAWIGGAALLLHIGLLWLFIIVFSWGMYGAAAAYDISVWLLSLAQVAYIMGWCKNEGWTGFSYEAFKDIWAFVRLSLASAVMLCLEIWYMMVLVVLTGHLGNAEIAVGSISICMNINGWEGMIFIGINAAISVRVSNELGSGRPRATMYAVIVVIGTSLVIGIVCMVAILVYREDFPIIFTNDNELQKAVSNIAGLLGVTMVLNSVQPELLWEVVGRL